MNRFDRDLFEALAPKNGPMKIIDFTGSKKGDRVHLRFGFPVNSDWISDITADEQNDVEAYFIDEGVELPWPLKYWQHKHIVRKHGEDRSLIIDDIQYGCSNSVIASLIYPGIYMGFAPRKKIYKKYFGE